MIVGADACLADDHLFKLSSKINMATSLTTTQSRVLKYAVRVHRFFVWPALICLFVWASSAFTHVLMVWTGPQPAKMFPPRLQMDWADSLSIPSILSRHNIRDPLLVKLVAGDKQGLLQVTEEEIQPRRYFDPSTGDELLDHERDQALFLARYYSGLEDTKIASIAMKTDFDVNYPSVNRLLPVYEVQLDTPDNLVLYVHTETGSVAFMTNDLKRIYQKIFAWLHTLSWLDDVEWLRVAFIVLLVGAAFCLSIAGVFQVFLMRRKTPLKQPGRRWHRQLAVLLWVPMIGMLFSGLYHLIYYADTAPQKTMRWGERLAPIDKAETMNDLWDKIKNLEGLDAVSLLSVPEWGNVYRVGIAAGDSKKEAAYAAKSDKEKRLARFAGQGAQKEALYFSMNRGLSASLSDERLAVDLATQYTGLSKGQVVSSSLITRFGSGYDFRNKRLPVWRVEYGNEAGDVVFIDLATGMLVDRAHAYKIYEGWSFTYLYKFNYLMFGGKVTRDAVIVTVLFAILSLAILGFRLHLKSKPRRAPKKALVEDPINIPTE